MAITAITGNCTPDAEVALLDDAVAGAADFQGRPARRSRTGSWKSASFIIGMNRMIVINPIGDIFFWMNFELFNFVFGGGIC